MLSRAILLHSTMQCSAVVKCSAVHYITVQYKQCSECSDPIDWWIMTTGEEMRGDVGSYDGMIIGEVTALH